MHQDLVDAWQPDDRMQAMVVKTLVDKSWEKLQLRQARLDAQLVAMDLAQVQAQKAQLQARRSPLFLGIPSKTNPNEATNP
jgi:hypothetical protein